MYEAAERFRDRCVGEGRSFLWPGEHAWTPETIDSLLEAFTGENADTGDRTFVQKWEDQLADEPETVHRVAADVMAFYFLFPSNVSRSKKLQVVREVIGWKLQSDAPDLAFLEQAYSASVGHGGMLYNTRRPEQVMFYLEFARDLLSSRKKPTDLEACKSLADKVKKRLKASNPARNILLHSIIFTSSYFTDGAIQQAKPVAGFRSVVLIDGNLIVETCFSEEVGVKSVSLPILSEFSGFNFDEGS